MVQPLSRASLGKLVLKETSDYMPKGQQVSACVSPPHRDFCGRIGYCDLSILYGLSAN